MVEVFLQAGDILGNQEIVLGQEMGIVDRIDNPYTSRNYGDYYVVLLLKDVGHYDKDPDPFVFQVAPQMWTQENAHKQKRFHFERLRSPVSAAEEVATWLRRTICSHGLVDLAPHEPDADFALPQPAAYGRRDDDRLDV